MKQEPSYRLGGEDLRRQDGNISRSYAPGSASTSREASPRRLGRRPSVRQIHKLSFGSSSFFMRKYLGRALTVITAAS
jgi:hypothetical protein